MIGAIAGDMIGSPYEFSPIKKKDFPLFINASTYTDDSVLTIAVADAIMSGDSFSNKLREYYNLYPNAGYGRNFISWARSNSVEPCSFGNGSAMRVSPVGWAYDTLEEVLDKAKESAKCTHGHVEGIKGAQVVAGVIYLARTGSNKKRIKKYVQDCFGYNLERKLDDIRPLYGIDTTCQGSVPEAIIAFLESDDYESAVRNAVSLGGDSDTQACIAGAIAEAFYGGVPEDIKKNVMEILSRRSSVRESNGILREVTTKFIDKFCGGLK